MAKQEAKEIGWMLKWALIIGFMGAIIGPIIFIQNHLHWKIAGFDYYIFFFKELFSNPDYAEGLKSFYLSSIMGFLIGSFGPFVLIFKK